MRRSRRSVLTATAVAFALAACGGTDTGDGGATGDRPTGDSATVDDAGGPPGGDGAAAAGVLPASDHVHALRASRDGTLLLGLHGALWRSTDGGRTWQQAGLEGQDAMSIGADPGSDGPLLVGGHGILARSRDGSSGFETLSPPELGNLDIHALAQAPTDPRLIYAFEVTGGIFASTDAGDTWEPRSPVGESFGMDVVGLAVSPDDPRTVLAAGGRTGIVRSTDGARTFDRVLDVGAFSLAYIPDTEQLVAITQRGIERSDDRGATWQVVAAPSQLRADGQPAGQLAAIAASGDGTLWLITEEPRTLLRSDDRGETWTEVART